MKFTMARSSARSSGRPIKFLWHAIDERLIDGTVNGVARITSETGDAARHVESGNTRSYATWMVIGAVAFTSLLFWLAVR